MSEDSKVYRGRTFARNVDDRCMGPINLCVFKPEDSEDLTLEVNAPLSGRKLNLPLSAIEAIVELYQVARQSR